MAQRGEGHLGEIPGQLRWPAVAVSHVIDHATSDCARLVPNVLAHSLLRRHGSAHYVASILGWRAPLASDPVFCLRHFSLLPRMYCLSVACVFGLATVVVLRCMCIV